MAVGAELMYGPRPAECLPGYMRLGEAGLKCMDG